MRDVFCYALFTLTKFTTWKRQAIWEQAKTRTVAYAWNLMLNSEIIMPCVSHRFDFLFNEKNAKKRSSWDVVYISPTYYSKQTFCIKKGEVDHHQRHHSDKSAAKRIVNLPHTIHSEAVFRSAKKAFQATRKFIEPHRCARENHKQTFLEIEMPTGFRRDSEKAKASRSPMKIINCFTRFRGWRRKI